LFYGGLMMSNKDSHKENKSFSPQSRNLIKKSWLIYSAEEVEQLVVKLGKAGKSPAFIGLILRDNYGVPYVRTITGKKITHILADNNLRPKIPETLQSLIRKDILLIKHAEMHKKDITIKRGLQLSLSKINRLSAYYIREGVLPLDWRYDRSKAKSLLE